MSTPTEQKLYDDPKYRSYASQIEKALKNFEYSTEWADLISALVRLNKVLQANTSYEYLPKRITIGKRLAQCLHPALPGGVHIKALDVYDTIFKIIGKKRLVMDLHIYGAGVFSLLANASMQVRPVLLNVYETHLLPLGENLRISLDGVLLGLLPGLEEGSELFDRINHLLDKMSRNVGLQYFYSSLWRCVLSSPSASIVRISAMQLVLRQFDKQKMTDDQLHLIGLDVDVMVNAVCEALQDDNVLTQRATLDVLGYCFPLSSLPVSRSDAQQILSSAVYILLRRDMSLNRRLYSWILGTDATKSSQNKGTHSRKSDVQYFEQFSRGILTSALLDISENYIEAFRTSCCTFNLQSFSGVEVKFIRVLISLLDNSEVGPVILDDLLISLLRFIDEIFARYKVMSSSTSSCKKCGAHQGGKESCARGQAEFVKAVNLFINTFEVDYIWNVLAENFITSCEGAKNSRKPEKSSFSIQEICSAISSLLHIVSMEAYVEIQTIHLPDLLNKIFIALDGFCDVLSENDIAICLELSIEILKHVQPLHSGVDHEQGVTMCIQSFQKFLVAFIMERILNEKSAIENFLSDLQQKSEGLIIPTGYDLLTTFSATKTRREHVQFQSHDENNEIVLQAFQNSCKLLVDICCFPVFATKNNHNDREDRIVAELNLPDWILCLIACACCKNFESGSVLPLSQTDLEYFYGVRMIACSTVLELMAVTATFFHKNLQKDENDSERSVVSVVVQPPLLPSHLDWINKNTNFYEQLCGILWLELGSTVSSCSTPARNWSCSRLLFMLHRLCPDETVERLLLQDILSIDQTSRVIAIKKFAKLWHYIIRGNSENYKSSKTFSRCLFAVLDQLTIDRYVLFPDVAAPPDSIGQAIVSTTVVTWLRDALENGGLSGILEPYILILLNGRTHRKSLQNVLEYRNDKNNQDMVLNFFEKHNQQLSDFECENCVELQRNMTDETSLWSNSKYQNFSVDSVLTFALCEVHQQIAKERHRYEYLVGLLTLSDETESINNKRIKSTCMDEDITAFATGFVKMIISQGLDIYKSQVEGHGEFTNSSVERSTEIAKDSVFELEDDKYLTDADSIASKATEAIELNQSFMSNGNPLYDHVLIYQESFDANCVLYSLQGILNMASAHSQVFIYAACTTSLASSESSYSNLVQELLVRHERSIEQGRCFYEATSPSSKGVMRNRMLVEVLISICLNYLRSAFYTDIVGNELNHEIQSIAAKLLRFIIKELTVLAQQDEASNKGTKLHSSTKQFSAYIVLVLQRHQVQSVVLTCLLTAIYALKNQDKMHDDENQSFSTDSDTLLDMDSTSDEIYLHSNGYDQLVTSYLGSDPLRITTMFSQFLSLVLELVNLEHFAFSKERKMPLPQKMEHNQNPSISLKKKNFYTTKPRQKRSQRLLSHLLSASHQYDSDSPIASQKIFVSTILEIYRLEKQPKLHQECSICLHSVLPFLGTALSSTVVPVLLQQCLNLENVSKQISSKLQLDIPPSYLESTIKSILTIIHYCLLTDSASKNSDNKSNIDTMQNDALSLNSTKTGQSVTGGSIGSGLSTLLNVFNSSSSKTSTVSNEVERSDGLFTAKVSILNNLARIVSCMCVIWRDIVSTENSAILPADETKSVSYNILQLLGPLAMQYGEYLLVAFSLVWQDRESEANTESKETSALSSFLKPNKELEYIIDFLMSIRLLSTEMLFSLVKQVIKNPPPTTNEAKGRSLQESVLHMLLCYMKRHKPAVLMENWSGFLGILQDTLALGSTQTNPNNTPSSTTTISTDCYFLLMYVLSEYVKRATAFSQKKEQRELQEIVTKCIDACNSVAGSSLEQGTWIRRNVSVLPGPQVPEGANRAHKKTESQSSLDLTDLPSDIAVAGLPLHVSSSDTLVTTLARKAYLEVNGVGDPRPDSARERPNTLPSVSKLSLNPVNFRNSLKALTVLSEVVANLLDVVYSSDEKEKVIPTLLAIMANVTPYLRNHGKDNAPSFCACISFLASISGFQYTRKAWRKDVIDLFLDAPFFHMPQECVEGWKTVIDNLMTHDKTTFKEVMSRTSLSRPGTSTPTLSIFSNKEQELELRALHIKRLAFIVFSSETDQYLKQLPEVQERLAESIRLNSVPGVQCRVFLCFRVLLLRISPHSLTSLWPTMFTELVHAMLQLEQALEPSFQDNTNNHKTKSKQKSSKGNSPSSQENQKTVMTCWFDMYLSACKFLDLALCLPVQYVPQFQLYKWSFIGEISSDTSQDISKNSYQTNGPENSNEEENPDPVFIPHCVRIQKLLGDLYPERKYKLLTTIPGKPLLNITRLKSLDQLQLFFNTVTSPSYLLNTQNSHSISNRSLKRNDSMDLSRNLPSVENNLEKDFFRPML